MRKASTERVDFTGSQGHRLAAKLEQPSGPVRAYAIFAHCFTCSKDIAAAARISRALAEHAIGVLRFDFTGLGGSDGDFSTTNFSSNVQDLLCAADWLRQMRSGPALLVGHSLGGSAVLVAAGKLPEVAAVATIGAPADVVHVRRLFADHVHEIEMKGEAEVELVGRRFRIRKQFLDDIAQHRIEEAIATLKRPLLVMHSPFDRTVGVEHASRIFLAAKHPKSFLSLDTPDHLLTRREDSAYVAETLAAWASRYLPSR